MPGYHLPPVTTSMGMQESVVAPMVPAPLFAYLRDGCGISTRSNGSQRGMPASLYWLPPSFDLERG